MPWLWKSIEWMNGLIFKLVFRKKIIENCTILLNLKLTDSIIYREIKLKDLLLLETLLNNLEKDKVRFFEAHAFDHDSLVSIFNNPSFIMMGVFFDTRLVGYFFLRCFVNKKCFVGRLVDKDFRGKGIGKTMNEILYNTSWDSGFRCYATISKNNQLVMKAHINNDKMVIRKQLADDHLLVEFIKV